jgi:hypothetical protein
MSIESALRESLCRWGRSLFERGLTAGSSGNLSARLTDGFLVTPTNACLGFLEPDRLAKLDPDGQPISGDKPTKEVPLHLSFYRARPQAGGVVHLHSTYATLLSCLADADPANMIPPITPYVVMRVGRVPLIPYTHPGSTDVAPLGCELRSGGLRRRGTRGDRETRHAVARPAGAPSRAGPGGGAAQAVRASLTRPPPHRNGSSTSFASTGPPARSTITTSPGCAATETSA